MRTQYTKRLDALDNKESYLLDLAAEEGWPKDKLRTKIDTIRRERKDIRATLDHAERRLDDAVRSSGTRSPSWKTHRPCTSVARPSARS